MVSVLQQFQQEQRNHRIMIRPSQVQSGLTKLILLSHTTVVLAMNSCEGLDMSHEYFMLHSV